MALDRLLVIADRLAAAGEQEKHSGEAPAPAHSKRPAARKCPTSPATRGETISALWATGTLTCCAMPSTSVSSTRTRPSLRPGNLPVIHPSPMGSVPAMMPSGSGRRQAASRPPQRRAGRAGRQEAPWPCRASTTRRPAPLCSFRGFLHRIEERLRTVNDGVVDHLAVELNGGLSLGLRLLECRDDALSARQLLG